MKGQQPIQHRTRFRFGPGGLAYVLVTTLILGAGIYTQANLLFWSFGLMVGGLVVSGLLTWLSLRGVRVQRLLPEHGVAGDLMVIRYRLTNRSRFPVFGLVVHETWGRGNRGWKRSGPIADRPPQLRGRPHGWVLHLGPHQTVGAEAPCWPTRRGGLSFERIVLHSGFPFGIFRRVVEVSLAGEVVVYPHLYRLNRRVLHTLSALDPAGRKQVNHGGGTEEFFGLRPYRAGDSMKLIDWKHTARTGNLLARELTQSTPPRIMVLLDLRRPGLPQQQQAEERAISLAASLICDAHFHGYKTGLAVAGVRAGVFRIHRSLPHRTRMLAALARLDTAIRSDLATPLPEKPSVVIVAGEPSPGPSPGPSGPSTAVVLDAAELDQYVADDPTPASALLNRRPQKRVAREHERVEAVDRPDAP